MTIVKPRRFPPKPFHELMEAAARRAGVTYTVCAGMQGRMYRLAGRRKAMKLVDLVRYIDGVLITKGKRPSNLLPPTQE